MTDDLDRRIAGAIFDKANNMGYIYPARKPMDEEAALHFALAAREVIREWLGESS